MKQSSSLFSLLGFGLGFSLILSLPVLADQCSYVTKEQALIAMSRLDINDTIYKLCEPCGERMSKPIKINHLSLVKAISLSENEHYWEIEVNHQGIDLAYAYVNSGIEDNFVNLAAVVNCEASDVNLKMPRQAEEFLPWEEEDESFLEY